jgi:hypothetical protein
MLLWLPRASAKLTNTCSFSVPLCIARIDQIADWGINNRLALCNPGQSGIVGRRRDLTLNSVKVLCFER